MDVTHPALTALGIFVLYVLVVTALWRVNRVEYTRIAESSDTVFRGLVVSIGVGLATLVMVTTALGWWPDVMAQERTGSDWTLVVPALFLVAGALSVLSVDYRSLGTRRVLVLAIGSLVVGVTEELLARGLLVVGAQQAGWAPVWVWLFSSALFSLLHAINALFGLPWKAMLGQLAASFLGGTVLFVTLMVTGSLLPGIVLHALWDFGGLGHQAADRPMPKPVPILIVAVYLVGLVAAVVSTI